MDNEFDNTNAETVNILLKFIQETKEGKFTTKVPTVASVTYQRLEIQEQSEEIGIDQNEAILFGVS